MKSVTFDNSRGFALGFDEAAPSPFVTWQFTETENGQKDYYWGHYHSSGQTAEKDFAKRVADYKELFGVHERTDGHEQAEYYRYYSTQRPVDLGTFPKPPGNAPVEIINFDERRKLATYSLRFAAQSSGDADGKNSCLVTGQTYSVSAPSFIRKKVLTMNEEWSNDACRGYVIKAMENCGFHAKDIHQVLVELYEVFDFCAVEEAAHYYENWQY